MLPRQLILASIQKCTVLQRLHRRLAKLIPSKCQHHHYLLIKDHNLECLANSISNLQKTERNRTPERGLLIWKIGLRVSTTNRVKIWMSWTITLRIIKTTWHSWGSQSWDFLLGTPQVSVSHFLFKFIINFFIFSWVLICDFQWQF